MAPSNCQVNVHHVEDLINLDDLIDFTVMSHKTEMNDPEDTKSNDNSDDLLAFMAGTKSDAGDIRKVLAAKRTPDKSTTRKANEANSVPSSIQVGEYTYYLNKSDTKYTANMALFHYRVGQHNIVHANKALVDRGANGGIVGEDMVIVDGSQRHVDVSGLDGHKVSQLHIVTAQALIQTHKGNAIATFHQMAYLGKGHSILSCIQMEHHGAEINDRSTLLPGGKQRILIDNYPIPLDIIGGLPYLCCHKPTDEEVATLPHIIMTSDVEWDPSVYDHKIDDMEKFYYETKDIVEYNDFDLEQWTN